MSRFHSHISSAIKIIETYSGDGAFSFHLKKYFSANKKFGSTDRKTIAALCYSYFRAANALKNKDREERILDAFFLCSDRPVALLQALRPELNARIAGSIQEKSALLQITPMAVFPFVNELSEEINNSAFYISFFSQPALFLRVRPGKRDQVLAKLAAAGVEYGLRRTDCLELKNSSALHDVIELNKEAVVQDDSSQQVFSYPDKLFGSTGSSKTLVWDCCAASGGKSILLYDKLKGAVELTVSDIRENILLNCKKRLRQAGIHICESFIADLSENKAVEKAGRFPIIICDVPCSGSGTWARTPEQLLFFTRDKIEAYAERQKKIAFHATGQLAPEGLFFYITCSVFKKENEDVADYLGKQCNLTLLSMRYIKGYESRADTMFVAVFTS